MMHTRDTEGTCRCALCQCSAPHVCFLSFLQSQPETVSASERSESSSRVAVWMFKFKL